MDGRADRAARSGVAALGAPPGPGPGPRGLPASPAGAAAARGAHRGLADVGAPRRRGGVPDARHPTTCGATRRSPPRPPAPDSTSSSPPVRRPASRSPTSCPRSPRSSSVAEGEGERGASTLYISPTKALAQDQLAGDRDARARGPGHHPRRRLLPRRARLDPRARRVRPHQPRHAPPLAPAAARPVGRALPLARPGRGRRVPPLPRRLRRPRRPGAAPPAPGLRPPRLRPDVRARLGDGRQPRRARVAPDRARRDGREPRRLAPRRGGARAVGAALHVVRRRERRARTPRRVVGVRRPAGRPGQRGRADPGLRPLPPGGRAGGDRPRPACSPRSTLRCPGVSRATAAATSPRSGARSSRRCATGGCSAWPPPTRSSWASTSRGSTP